MICKQGQFNFERFKSGIFKLNTFKVDASRTIVMLA